MEIVFCLKKKFFFLNKMFHYIFVKLIGSLWITCAVTLKKQTGTSIPITVKRQAFLPSLQTPQGRFKHSTFKNAGFKSIGHRMWAPVLSTRKRRAERPKKPTLVCQFVVVGPSLPRPAFDELSGIVERRANERKLHEILQSVTQNPPPTSWVTLP